MSSGSVLKKKYNVEFISVDTGEEERKPYLTFSQIEILLLKMQEGDTMVVTSLGRQPDLYE